MEGKRAKKKFVLNYCYNIEGVIENRKKNKKWGSIDMTLIQVHFMGKPLITVGGREIHIQQKKVQALFLYILFNTNCTRDELAAMFWCDSADDEARRNLRNGLYRLKKAVGDGIITTTGNAYVQLNPQLKVERDVDLFVTEGSDEALLQLHDTGFLDKFFVKNCPEFESWVTSIRSTYEKILLERLDAGLKKNLQGEDAVQAERYAQRVLALDPYREDVGRSYMHLLSKRGAYNDAIKIYAALSDTLEKDLGVEPESSTMQLYRDILSLKKGNMKKQDSQLFFADHFDIVLRLEQEYTRFLQGKPYQNIVLSGNVGSGKNSIIEAFLESAGVSRCVRLQFHLSGAEVPYAAAEKVFTALEEDGGLHSSRYAFSANTPPEIEFLRAMERIAENVRKSNRPQLVILQNLEFVDERSMVLIFTLLFDRLRGKAMVLAGCCPNLQRDATAADRLTLAPDTLLLTLRPANLNEMMQWMVHTGDKHILNHSEPAAIHRYTQGHFRFVQDVVNNMKKGAPDPFAVDELSKQAVREIFVTMGDWERYCLECLSLFRDGLEIEALETIMGKDTLFLLDIIGKLRKRQLLEEVRMDAHLLIRIAPPMLRRAVYERIPNFNRVELHKIVGAYYETKHRLAPRDYFFLSELSCHYSFTDKQYERMYYGLRDLQYRLDYSDEFFPTIRSTNQVLNTFNLHRSEAYTALEQYRSELADSEGILPDGQFHELSMLLDFLYGRTLTRGGKRNEGIVCIKKLVFMAQKLGRNDMLLKGYMETVFYAIKEENEPLMREYVEKSKQIAKEGAYELERGILLRLEALCDIRVRRYTSAEALLHQSIEVFQHPSLLRANYPNIAAAYDYLALICRSQRRYAEAKQYLQAAIDLCLERNMKKSLDLFYEDYGYILFLEENFDEAKRYFALSFDIYDTFGTYWLRSVGESCMAMIAARERQTEKALEHFRRAEIFSKKDHTKEELEILEDARRELKKHRIL